MGYLRTISLFLSYSFSFSPPFSSPRPLLPRTRCSPAASSSLFHLPTLLLILLHHPPPSTDILFRSLTLLSPRASHLTPPSRLKAPGCPRPSSPAPNPAPSAIDTPMRATPRQGRCASHNGRRCRDSRGEERGPTDSRVAAGERTRGFSPARRREKERRSRKKSLRTEARRRKRAETEKSRKREAERKYEKEKR